MMYYATYRGIAMREVFGFLTMQARDAWVNHVDSFSLATGTTNINCFVKRIAIDSPGTIKRIENAKNYKETKQMLDIDDGIIKSLMKIA